MITEILKKWHVTLTNVQFEGAINGQKVWPDKVHMWCNILACSLKFFKMPFSKLQLPKWLTSNSEAPRWRRASAWNVKVKYRAYVLVSGNNNGHKIHMCSHSFSCIQKNLHLVFINMHLWYCYKHKGHTALCFLACFPWTSWIFGNGQPWPGSSPLMLH